MSDLISRKKLLEQIQADSEGKEGQYGDEWLFIDTINAIPAAEPKVGKWIERDDGWENVFYECSECGEAFTLIDGTPTDNLYYYCPFCGAKMKRSE